MNDQAASNDTVRAWGNCEQIKGDRQFGATRRIRGERRQIASVAFHFCRVSVTFAARIEVAAGAHAVTRTAVAFVMNMKAMLGSGLETLYVRDDANFGAHLREGDRTGRLIALGGFQHRDCDWALDRRARATEQRSGNQ